MNPMPRNHSFFRWCRRLVLLVAVCHLWAAPVVSQDFNQNLENGTTSQQSDDSGNNGRFNPHSKDSTKKNKIVPKGIYTWMVDRKFGDIRPAVVDTLPHLYPQSTMATGMYGDYNTTGSNYTARQTRIFTDRRATSQFLFTDAYDQSLVEPDEWHFTNSLSPITNLSYGSCGDKTDGEDFIKALFAVNAGKKTGLGFDLDYRYARGYFQNQNNSHFGASLYASHLGDRYQMHVLLQTYHQKSQENGGITNDDYITHPELYTVSYSDNEIPVILTNNWNRNNHLRLFLTHRYSVGFYRQVPMTEEEIKARKFAEASEKEKKGREMGMEAGQPLPAGRPDNAKIVKNERQRVGDGTSGMEFATADSLVTDSMRTDSLNIGSQAVDSLATANSSKATDRRDSGRIKVDSKEKSDSLLAAQSAPGDSIDQYMKREFVPVTSFIHTAEISHHDHIYQAYNSPTGLYADTLYNMRPGGGFAGDSIYDQTKLLAVRNTLSIALLEGFNKYAPAGLKGFVTHDLRRLDMPDLDAQGTAYMSRWTEHNVSVGGQLLKSQGNTLHYNLTAEAWVAGEDAGQLTLDATGDLNFRLLGDTVRLDARAFMHRQNPTFLQRRFHSKHLWWDNDFSKQTHTRLEGRLTIRKTNTSLRVAFDEIENYTYLGMSYVVDDENHTGLTARFRQHDASLTVLTAQLAQRLRLGPLHWENIVTFQSSSDQDVLPLPKLNVFTNLYFEFLVARVLNIEMGASGTWFTKYHPADYLPHLNQYAVQQNADARTELGNFPFVDVYANLHLKHTRFFIMMTNVLGKDLNRMAFLTPHYPINRSVLHLGVSWNFFN